jgi:hypothetical protein
MPLLLEADIIDNDNVAFNYIQKKAFKPRNRRCMLYKIWKGDKRIAARAEDSTWYLMYIKYSMLNVPKIMFSSDNNFCCHMHSSSSFLMMQRGKNGFPV